MALDIAHITERDATDLTPTGQLQREWELHQMLRLYDERRPQNVLEVGTYKGGTLAHFVAVPWQPQIVSVDTFTAYDARPTFAKRNNVTFVQGQSSDPATVAQVAKHGLFDWIFLDAGHAEHEIQADWDAYRPLCAPGGVILLHDILPGRNAQAWIQVAPVWRRIQRQGYVIQEIVASVDVDWGGIGVVYL